MKKILALSGLICLSVTLLFAEGFTGPKGEKGGKKDKKAKKEAVTSVEEALSAKDDQQVTIKGKIVRSLGNEKYEFSDGEKTIVIEIDDDDWKGLSVSPDDTIEIQGKVEKEWRHSEIEVKRFQKVN